MPDEKRDPLSTAHPDQTPPSTSKDELTAGSASFSALIRIVNPRTWDWSHPAATLAVPIALGIIIAYLPQAPPLVQCVSWVAALILLLLWLRLATPFRAFRAKGAITVAIVIIFLGLAYRPAMRLFAPSSPSAEPADIRLAYVSGVVYTTMHKVPNQGPDLIYLPTDFDVSNRIRGMFSRSNRWPVASSPTFLKLQIRNEGAEPWISYTLEFTVHYELRGEFSVQGRDWAQSRITRVDEDVVVGNCRPDGFLCEDEPVPANGGTLTKNFVNLSGAMAVIQLPTTLMVKLPNVDHLVPVSIEVGKEILREQRAIDLPPNREGQNGFIR